MAADVQRCKRARSQWSKRRGFLSAASSPPPPPLLLSQSPCTSSSGLSCNFIAIFLIYETDYQPIFERPPGLEFNYSALSLCFSPSSRSSSRRLRRPRGLRLFGTIFRVARAAIFSIPDRGATESIIEAARVLLTLKCAFHLAESYADSSSSRTDATN